MTWAIVVVATGLTGMTIRPDVGNAQSYALPRGSSLAATPPIDQRGKQFRALSRAQKRLYVKQGYRGPGWQRYR